MLGKRTNCLINVVSYCPVLFILELIDILYCNWVSGKYCNIVHCSVLILCNILQGSVLGKRTILKPEVFRPFNPLEMALNLEGIVYFFFVSVRNEKRNRCRCELKYF